MAEQSKTRPSTAYRCQTCDAEFVVRRAERAVCCPVCRMNRIRTIEQ